MKSITKLTLMVMVLALTAWAQTATQNPSSSDAQKAPVAQSSSKPDSTCCQKIADSKDAMACCHHAAKGNDAEMACCNGTNAKSCMKTHKSAKASCVGGKCCADKDAEDCGAASEKDGKMAMACCGKGQCGLGHGNQGNMDK